MRNVRLGNASKARIWRVRPRTPRHKPGTMNRTEALFERFLLEKYPPPQHKVRFESLKLRLAADTFYTPDFTVISPSGLLVFEVKGFWRDDARVKIKVAAQTFPEFEFFAVTPPTRKDARWKVEPFYPWG